METQQNPTQNDTGLNEGVEKVLDSRSPAERFGHFTRILPFQIISAFGSQLTSFALTVWAYQTFNSFTNYSLIFFAAYMSVFLASPIAGNMVDRWNKKSVLLYSSMASASITLTIALLYWLEMLGVWHIFFLTFANGIFMAFSRPAIITVIKMLIAPDDLPRANGIMATGFGMTTLLAPMIAGSLMLNVGLFNILLIDLTTFLIGIISLSRLRLPFAKLAPPEPLVDGIKFAWNYLLKKSPLLWLIGFYAILNFFTGIAMVLLQPMILSLTDTQGLGMVMTIGGVGYVVGASVIAAWGGPNRKIYSIYGAGLFMSLCMIVIPVFTNIWILAVGAFVLSAALPVFLNANMVIIQRKAETAVIGRVDGLGTILSGFLLPIGYLVGGPMAEFIFEPLMMAPRESLAWVQGIYGLGEGRGAALLISLSSLALFFIVLLAMSVSQLRNIEIILPDEE